MFHALTLAVFLAWWYLLAVRWWDSSLTERILGAFILTVTQIVWSIIALGIIHWITWWSVFLVNLWVFFLICWWARQDPFTHETRILSTRYNPPNLLGINPPSLLAGLLALFCIAVVAWCGLRLPAMAYDSYHLIKAALMVQEGHLQPFGWDGLGIDYYPAHAECLFAWWILGTRNDAWACVTQLAFGLAMALSVYRLVRYPVSGSREVAMFCGALVFSVPTVLQQCWMATNDLVVAGSIATAWAFIARKRLTLMSVGLGALAASFAWGTKTSAGYWIMGIVAFLAWRWVHDRPH